VTELSQLLSV